MNREERAGKHKLIDRSRGQITERLLPTGRVFLELNIPPGRESLLACAHPKRASCPNLLV